jgi:hypothetical protein
VKTTLVFNIFCVHFSNSLMILHKSMVLLPQGPQVVFLSEFAW